MTTPLRTLALLSILALGACSSPEPGDPAPETPEAAADSGAPSEDREPPADRALPTERDLRPDQPPPTKACGNGKLDPGEQCDLAIPAGKPGACPTPSSCNDGSSCTTDSITGAGTCAAHCTSTPVTKCQSGDGCCPTSCTTLSDGDCSPSCGNGAVESGELCDTLIPAGKAGACPASCDDGKACTKDALLNGGTCNAQCTATPITKCQSGDGCCPTGCTALNDGDCSPSCGNGAVEPGELCDTAILAGKAGACPGSCDDGKACTVDALLNPGTCNAQCSSKPITQCQAGDGCCPAGCNALTDSDCSASCGNGLLEPGELCDTAIAAGKTGACPTSCNDGKSCTLDTLLNPGSCSAECAFAPLSQCTSGDGCCAPGCGALDDADCWSGCNGGCGAGLTGSWRAGAPKPGELVAVALRADAAFVALHAPAAETTGSWAVAGDVITLTASSGSRRYRYKLSAKDTMTVLEVDASLLPISPTVSFTLTRALPGYCKVADDCDRQPLPLPASYGAWSCVKSECWWSASAGCAEDAASESVGALPTVGAPSARRDHSAVWSGKEMIVWGGRELSGSQAVPVATGGRLELASGSWKPVTISGAPAARSHHLAVWTGSAMAILGGTGGSGTSVTLYDGGLFDPATNSWKSIPACTSCKSAFKRAFVIGGEILAWSGPLVGGARWNPATGAWTPVPPAESAGSLWTNGEATEVIDGTLVSYYSLSGSGYLSHDSCRRYALEGGAWSWSACSEEAAPYANPFGAAGAGKLVVFQPLNPYGNGLGWTRKQIEGAAYDPKADVWRKTASGPASYYYSSEDGLPWTGRDVVLCRHDSSYSGALTAGTRCVRYNPVTRIWSAEKLLESRERLSGGSVVVANGELLFWGGRSREIVAGFEVVKETTADGLRWRTPLCK